MDERVHITFSQCLKPGESAFQVAVPQQFLDKDRKFGLEFLSLVPDYHSKQAALYNMDPESEKSSVVENVFTIDFEVDNSYFHANPWEQTQDNVPLGVVIKSLNDHFLRTKPDGCVYPLAFIDWYHLDASGMDDVASRELYREMSHDFYGEAFVELKHMAQAPPKMRELHGFNGMLFPTNDSPNIVKNLRICIWMAPNTKLAFSNYDLPNILGFANRQLPEKRANNQVQLVNASLDTFALPECDLEPVMHVTKGLKTSKVHVYMLYKSGRSIPGRLATTLFRMHKYKDMASDYNKGLARMAQRMNFYLELVFDAAQKRFRFVYPTSQHVRLFVNVATEVAMQLGFGRTEQISPQMVAQVLESDEKLQEKALALVLDTRMVVVNLETSASQQNFHFKNTLMAILEPDPLGILTTKRTSLQLPRVPVSYYNPTLDFVLHRFDDVGTPIHLEWKVGAHVQGVLSGSI